MIIFIFGSTIESTKEGILIDFIVCRPVFDRTKWQGLINLHWQTPLVVHSQNIFQMLMPIAAAFTLQHNPNGNPLPRYIVWALASVRISLITLNYPQGQVLCKWLLASAPPPRPHLHVLWSQEVQRLHVWQCCAPSLSISTCQEGRADGSSLNSPQPNWWKTRTLHKHQYYRMDGVGSTLCGITQR